MRHSIAMPTGLPAVRVTGRPRLLLVLLALLVPILLLPALINGAPLLFSDSVGYFRAGDAAVDKVARLLPRSPDAKAAAGRPALQADDGEVSTSRSVYYGILYDAAFRLAGEWALPLLQVAAVLVSLVLALRRLIAPGPLATAGIIALLALPAGLGVFASTIMPDVFAGLMILGLALLLGVRLPRWEHAWWLAMVVAACLFHKSHVAVGAAMLALWLVGAVVLRRPQLRRAIMPAAAVVLAWFGHTAVDRAVQSMTGRPVAQTPFLMARMLADGSALHYLDAHCPTPTLRLCAEHHRLPMSENAFLWSRDPAVGLFLVLPPADRALVTAQSNAVVIGTIREFPGEVIGDSTRNFVAQLAGPGVTDFALRPKVDPAATPRLRDVLIAYRDTLVGRGVMPLGTISLVLCLSYAAGFAMLAAVFWQARRRQLVLPQCDVLVPIVLGVVANAAVCGVLAGVFDRYQGRVAWLIPLAAIVAWSAFYHQRSGRAENPAARSIA